MRRRAVHSPSNSSNSSSIRSDINVTPLVDVCLVRLLIFMVVTPMLAPDAGVRLPQTRAPRSMPEDSKQLVISIASIEANGSVHIGERRVPDAQLASELAAIHQRSPDRDVVVKGDRALPYQRVREVMRIVSEAGFNRVGLITERRPA